MNLAVTFVVLVFTVLALTFIIDRADATSREGTDPDVKTIEIELRVWQRVSNPLQVYLSARARGGSWGRTEQLPMDEANSSGTFRYSNRTVDDETARVELRVWQSVSDPLRVYLSARALGGSWGRTEQVPMNQTNARGTLRYGDLSVRVAQVPLLANDDDHADEIGHGATPATAGVAIEGELHYRSDRDVFVFEAEEGVLYRVDVTLGTLSYPRLTLYDADGRDLAYAYAVTYHYGQTESLGLRLEWEAPDAGTYYLAAGGYGRAVGSYALTITALPNDDDHADEIGHGATPAIVGGDTAGALHYKNDIDVFVFEAEKGALYRVDVMLGTLSYPGLSLHDADGRNLAYAVTNYAYAVTYYNDQPGSLARRHEWKAPDAGTYYLAMSGYREAGGSYTLAITAIPNADDHADGTGSGATPATAGVAIEGSLHERSLHYEGDVDVFDVDVFVFEAEEGALYRADVTLDTLIDSTLTLYNADGWELASNDDQAESRASRLEWRAPDAGTYYLAVGGYGEAGGSYALTITAIPNNDDHADEIGPGATPATIGGNTAGALNYGNDRDVFVFEAEEGVLYRVDVRLRTLVDSTLALYDADGRALAYDDDRDDAHALRIFWEAPSAGDYYVDVGGPGLGSYALTITALPNDDDHADEIGPEATTALIGVATAGALHYENDRDVFVFEAEEGVLYRVDVMLGTLANSTLALHGANGRYLASNDDQAASLASRLEWEAPDTGEYYVDVGGDGAGSYTLTITTINDDHADEIGSGATPAFAGVAIEGSLHELSRRYESDRDIFVFEAEEGALYRVDVTLGTLVDSTLALYDTDGRNLAYNNDQAESLASRTFWQAPSAGDYYVAVGSYGGGGGSYTLTITALPNDDDHGDEIGPGATPATIGVAIQGSLHYHYQGDVDIFVFEAEKGAIYRADVTLGTLSDSTLTLYDADGRELAYNDNQVESAASRLEWEALDTGTYYLAVGGYRRAAGSYALTITALTITALPNDDDHADEIGPGATRATAGVAIEGSLHERSRRYEYDVDVFVFEAEKGALYRVDVTLGTLSYPGLTLYDADGRKLAYPYGSLPASRIFWQAPSSGDHYVAVGGYGAGSYALTITAFAERENTQPGGPPHLEVVSLGSPHSMLLEWNGGPANTTKWQYRDDRYRRGSWSAWRDLPNSSAGTRSHLLTHLSTGTAHFFELRAIVGAAEGATSAVARGITRARGITLYAPLELPALIPNQTALGDGTMRWRLGGLDYTVVVPDGMRLRSGLWGIGSLGGAHVDLFDVATGSVLSFRYDPGTETGSFVAREIRERPGERRPGAGTAPGRDVNTLFDQIVASLAEVSAPSDGPPQFVFISATGACSFGIAVPNPEANTDLVRDCESLLALQGRLAGDRTTEGMDELNWSAERPMTSWTGVTVAGSPPRVTRLSLANSGLTGELLGWLGNLTALTELRLNGNALTGRVPSKLGNLGNLTHLYLAGNTLRGCLPWAWEDVANNDLATLGLPYCYRPILVQHGRDLLEGGKTYRFEDRYLDIVFDVPEGMLIDLSVDDVDCIADLPDCGRIDLRFKDVKTGSELFYDAHAGRALQYDPPPEDSSGRSASSVDIEQAFDALLASIW